MPNVILCPLKAGPARSRPAGKKGPENIPLEFSKGYIIMYRLILVIKETHETRKEGSEYRGVGDA